MAGHRRQLPFDFAHDPDYGADAFIEAPCNRAALAWIGQWPDWSAPGLAVHGPAGCGKTHLASIWQAMSGAVALSPSMLASDRIPSLLGEARAALIDTAIAPALDADGERALVHLYNLLKERGGHLLLLARTPPARWSITLADLRSRLSALPAVRIDAADDELLSKLLIKLFTDRQLDVAPEALGWLLPRMPRSFAAARLLVAELDRRALAAGRRISVGLARETLADMAPEDTG
jgi:chromosomal replication initiation ATPase DnaA